MTLQKGFFNTQSFNPRPYFDNKIVNLSGASMFEEDTVFKPGRYNVLIQAGGSCPNNTAQKCCSGKIQKDIIINQPFIVRAYCGSKGESSGGVNPYSGVFKVNPTLNTSVDVNHIFGTCGSSNKGSPSIPDSQNWLGSGNCLGNGWTRVTYSERYSCGAGSCMHILPVGGVFGTDYLFAFHTTAAPTGILLGYNGGAGSAYGGSASGGSMPYGTQGSIGQTSIRGGNTPYGNGGAGSYSGTGALASSVGNSGTGIGSGKKPTTQSSPLIIFEGSTAFFNGSTWEDPQTIANPNEDGSIVITWLGTL